MTRIGSLFSGAGGLDMAVESVFAGRTVWHSEVDPAASKVLAHRWPGVPNLGDVTTVDWASVEPVDVICGGSPCQDVSHAGRRAGMRAGTRSGLWASMVDAIDVLRPQYVVWENVRGVLSAEADSSLEPCAGCVGDGDDGPVLRALGRVLGDLADLGYDTRWCGLRAADVGAPHGRFRVFVVATDAERGRRAGRAPDARGYEIRRAAAGRTGAIAAADAIAVDGRPRWGVAGEPSGAHAQPAGCGAWPAADSSRDGRHEGRPEPARLVGGPDAAERGAGTAADAATVGCEGIGLAGGVEPAQSGAGGDVGVVADADHDAARDGREPRDATWGAGEPAQRRGRAAADTASAERRGAQPEHLRARSVAAAELGERPSEIAWGAYEPAIRRWERVLGRPAPAPTETGPKGSQRLSPAFVTWMMGWPDGWVTDVPGVTRNDALRICGNGVVPQQAAAALRAMLGAETLRPASELPSLLPTPAAMNPNDGESIETWEARRQRVKETAKNGNGFGTPLSIAVQKMNTDGAA